MVYDEEGEPLTVKYHVIASMLLNELEKLNERCEAQGERLSQIEVQLEELQSQTALVRE